MKILSQSELEEIFRLWFGDIALVLDPEVAPLLSATVGMRFLLDRGVQKVFLLDADESSVAPLPSECAHVMYFVRPEVRIVSVLCAQVHATRVNDGRKMRDFTCFFVPRLTPVAVSTVDRYGLHGILKLSTFALALVPVEDDVATLSLPLGALGAAWLHGDATSVAYPVAEALFELQHVYGAFDTIMAKGRTATRTAELLCQMGRRENLYSSVTASVATASAVPAPSSSASLVGSASSLQRLPGSDEEEDEEDDEEEDAQVAEARRQRLNPTDELIHEALTGEAAVTRRSRLSTLVIVDRELDLVTPCLTQLTYEGLIDEVLEIRAGVVDIDGALVHGASAPAPAPAASSGSAGGSSSGGGNAAPSARQKYPLDSGDELFVQLRDKPFVDALAALASVARSVKQEAQVKIAKTTLTDLHSFVAKLPQLLQMKKAITAHINISALLTEFTSNDPDFSNILKAENEMLVDGRREFTRTLLEDMILRRRPLARILRLLLLYSLHNGGFKPAHFDFFRGELLTSFGVRVLPALHALERLGWLVSNSHPLYRPLPEFNFNRFKRAYNCFGDFGSSEDPTDYSHIFSYSSYAPLSVRIIDQALRSRSWSVADSLYSSAYYPSSFSQPASSVSSISSSSALSSMSSSSLPSPPPKSKTPPLVAPSSAPLASVISRVMDAVDETKRSMLAAVAPSASPRAPVSTVSSSSSGPVPSCSLAADSSPQSIVVFFVGGVTFAEISALRFVAKMQGVKILVASTNMVNGTRLIEEICGPTLRVTAQDDEF